jgi:hypothetical protein
MSPARRSDVLPRFLIEVEHEPDSKGCKHIVKEFLDTGSHYLSHAEWGCQDGVHKAWMIVETDTREEAKAVVPPFMRSQARIIRLQRFFTDGMGEILGSHGAKP